MNLGRWWKARYISTIPPEERQMALNIKNPVAERLAKELARETGESLTEAVVVALRGRLAAIQRRQAPQGLMAEIEALQEFVRSQPDRDSRSAEDILGYDDFGLPR
jgi:antitoxin VapB